jgi:hypothetical protein
MASWPSTLNLSQETSMKTTQTYLADAKARALRGAPPRAASPFEWEEWSRVNGAAPTSAARRRTLRSLWSRR